MPVTKSATEPGGRLASVYRSHPQGRETCRLTIPKKYGIAVNFEAAKALGLTVSDKLLALADKLLALADEVIE